VNGTYLLRRRETKPESTPYPKKEGHIRIDFGTGDDATVKGVRSTYICVMMNNILRKILYIGEDLKNLYSSSYQGQQSIS